MGVLRRPNLTWTIICRPGLTPFSHTTTEWKAACSVLVTETTRADVLLKVAENPLLVQRERNRAFVLMQYFGYLKRNPNDAPDSNFDGYNFWLGKLNQFNGNYIQAEMVKAFIASSEYLNRF